MAASHWPPFSFEEIVMKDPIREQLIESLRGGHAHVTLEAALKNLPKNLRGVKPAGASYSAWQLLEHLRIAQSDILEFSRDPEHVSPQWPDGYWPKSEKPPSDAAWTKSIAAIRKDAAAMEKLVRNPKTDLFGKIAHGTGQTILREALLIIDHNAYHIGQLVLVRRMLGAWGD